MIRRLFFLVLLVALLGVPLSSVHASSNKEEDHTRVMMGSPEQYYNNALDAEARGDLADASLALRRALVLHPSFAAAQQKLKEILSTLGIPMQVTWKGKLVRFFSPDLLVFLGSFVAWSSSFLGIWLFFRRYLRATTSSKKKAVFLFSLLSFLFYVGSILVVLGTMIDPRTFARDQMVLLPPYDLKTSTGNREDRPSTASLRAAPIDNATIVMQVPTGSCLLLKSRHGVWSYVQLGSGEEGWISSAALQPLVPHSP